jgi:hypothetical protein
MSEFNQLSAVIGRLQEATERAQHDRREILAKLDALAEAVAIVPAIRDEIAELKPEVEKLKRARLLGLGALGVLSVGGGGLGGGIVAKLTELFGGGGN